MYILLDQELLAGRIDWFKGTIYPRARQSGKQMIGGKIRHSMKQKKKELKVVIQREIKANVHLKAEFVSTDRNRMMYITYKFAGFKEIEEDGNFIVLENNLERIQSVPEYIRLKVVD